MFLAVAEGNRKLSGDFLRRLVQTIKAHERSRKTQTLTLKERKVCETNYTGQDTLFTMINDVWLSSSQGNRPANPGALQTNRK